MRHTQYVNPLTFENEDRNLFSKKAELRIDDSEPYPGRLMIGTYGFNSGSEYGTIHVAEDRVRELRDILDGWLAEQAAKRAAPSDE